MLDAAFAVGRDGGFLGDAVARLRAPFHDTAIPVVVHPYDAAALTDASRQIALAVNPPSDRRRRGSGRNDAHRPAFQRGPTAGDGDRRGRARRRGRGHRSGRRQPGPPGDDHPAGGEHRDGDRGQGRGDGHDRRAAVDDPRRDRGRGAAHPEPGADRLVAPIRLHIARHLRGEHPRRCIRRGDLAAECARSIATRSTPTSASPPAAGWVA